LSSRNKKTNFGQCLRRAKVSQRYSSNVKSFVQAKDLILVDLKFHDYHVLMQQLLTVAIQDFLPNKFRHAITCMRFFFNVICSKVIDSLKLNDLENKVVIILCQLQMYFPSSFFYIMVHLIVHLGKEIKLCGFVYLL